MAVKLPSDLISDVLQNADTTRREQAMAKLQQASYPDRGGFVHAVEAIRDRSTVVSSWRNSSAHETVLSSAPGAARRSSEGGGVYRGFERMVLRNLFESLLPGEASGSFGSGPSAGIWRSMAADQLAGVFAERGGLGVADLLRSHQVSSPRHDSEWPYFSSDRIGSIKG